MTEMRSVSQIKSNQTKWLTDALLSTSQNI